MAKFDFRIKASIKGLWKWRLYLDLLIALTWVFPEYILPREMLYRSALGFARRHLKICINDKEYPIRIGE